MLALLKVPGRPAVRFELHEESGTQLEQMQAMVGGYIEIAVRGRDFVIWCDEEARLKTPLPALNFRRPTDREPVLGTVLVTAMRNTPDGQVCAPLSEEQAARIVALLECWADARDRVGRAKEDWDLAPDAHESIVGCVRRNIEIWKFIDENIGGIPGEHEPRVNLGCFRISRCSCGWTPDDSDVDTDDQFAHHVAIARALLTDAGST